MKKAKLDIDDVGEAHQETLEAKGTHPTQALTRLTEKAYSPLVIRKITKWGFPLFIAVITDDNLDTLDQTVVQFVNDNIGKWKSDSIQDKRWLAGALCEVITKVFPSTEGVAVLAAVDKTMISSLFGDFMTHGQCRIELFGLLNMSTNV